MDDNESLNSLKKSNKKSEQKSKTDSVKDLNLKGTDED